MRELLLVPVALVLGIQLVPYGWSHPNPPVREQATFPSAESEALFDVACADCHSNRTDWPVYSYVAPFSWLVRNHVEEGRDEFNVDDWGRSARKARKAAEELEEGEMPLDQYTRIHRDAKLSDSEKATLVAALREMAP